MFWVASNYALTDVCIYWARIDASVIRSPLRVNDVCASICEIRLIIHRFRCGNDWAWLANRYTNSMWLFMAQNIHDWIRKNICDFWKKKKKKLLRSSRNGCECIFLQMLIVALRWENPHAAHQIPFTIHATDMVVHSTSKKKLTLIVSQRSEIAAIAHSSVCSFTEKRFWCRTVVQAKSQQHSKANYVARLQNCDIVTGIK